ncbi:MAG TPA: hypothetical protein VMZ92_06955 [Planctomycetota bacterium]|nr:hypothetical protein [Planctomycetota bacterium]
MMHRVTCQECGIEFLLSHTSFSSMIVSMQMGGFRDEVIDAAGVGDRWPIRCGRCAGITDGDFGPNDVFVPVCDELPEQ